MHISRYLILFLMFACCNFPFRAFVTLIYWTWTEVLLNLAAPPHPIVPSFDFEQINIFWTSGFDSVSIVFDLFSVSKVSMNSISCIRFKCSFFWPWENQYMVHGFDSISITQFPAMIFSVSAEGSPNRVALHIYLQFSETEVTRGFELVTRGFELALLNFNSWF